MRAQSELRLQTGTLTLSILILPQVKKGVSMRLYISLPSAHPCSPRNRHSYSSTSLPPCSQLPKGLELSFKKKRQGLWHLSCFSMKKVEHNLVLHQQVLLLQEDVWTGPYCTAAIDVGFIRRAKWYFLPHLCSLCNWLALRCHLIEDWKLGADHLLPDPSVLALTVK